MDNNNQNDLGGVPTTPAVGGEQQNNESIPEVKEDKPKTSKTTVVLLAIIAVITTVIAAVFAYLYFTNLPNGSGDGGGSGGGQSSESSSDSGSNNSSSGSEGSGNAGVDENEIIGELKEKVGVILGKIRDDSTIRIGRSLDGSDFTLISDGVLPMNVNIETAIKSSMVKPISLTDDQIAVIVNKEDESGREYFKQYLEENRDVVAYNADDVAAAYYNIFGTDTEIVHQRTHRICPYYNYDADLNIYYHQVPGCGGQTPYYRQYYVYDYEIAGDNAYVYMVAGMAFGDDLYCDVYTPNSESWPVCGSVEYKGYTDDDFVITSSNYQNFAKYRFVFNKASDGTYYFVKVEKL